MNLPRHPNKQWEEIESDHPALRFHVEHYPYLGIIPEKGGHYYAWHDQGIQGVVIISEAESDHLEAESEIIWEVGCSFKSDYRGIDAKKACQCWLSAYELTYNPLQARCLQENRPAQYLAIQLGFKPENPQGGWKIYQYSHQ